MPRPIAILSDFGHTDAYAGVMKAVILSRCPEVPLLDLTHGIPAGDVFAGALQLASAVPYCPADTIFLAVVDPGVGGDRRPICLRSSSRLFVGPDNGLLWPGASGLDIPAAFHLDRPRYWLPGPGFTFHGRDVFAPIAALLALGRAAEDVGTPIADPVRLEIPPCARLDQETRGEVIYVDHFGNAVTNLRPGDLGHPAPGTVLFQVGGRELRGPATHYGAVPAGEPLVLCGSLGYLEVAVHGGSAAASLGLAPGCPVSGRCPRAGLEDRGDQVPGSEAPST